MSHGLKILTKKEPKTLQRKTLLLRDATLRGRTKTMKAWDTLVVINILTRRRKQVVTKEKPHQK